MIAASACMAVGAIPVVLAQGHIAAKTMESMARNPAAADRLAPNMIIAMAICESIAIYCLVISLIILFVV